MKKVKIQIYPAQHTIKQRLTVIFNTLLGKPYYLTMTQANVWKLHDQIYNDNN